MVGRAPRMDLRPMTTAETLVRVSQRRPTPYPDGPYPQPLRPRHPLQGTDRGQDSDPSIIVLEQLLLSVDPRLFVTR